MDGEGCTGSSGPLEERRKRLPWEEAEPPTPTHTLEGALRRKEEGSGREEGWGWGPPCPGAGGGRAAASKGTCAGDGGHPEGRGGEQGPRAACGGPP